MPVEIHLNPLKKCFCGPTISLVAARIFSVFVDEEKATAVFFGQGGVMV